MRSLIGRHLLWQLLLMVVFVAFLAWRFDLTQALRDLTRTDPRWMAGGVALLGISLLVQGYRWRLTLPGPAPLWTVIGIYLVSRLANVFIPFRGGDVMRVQFASARLGRSRSQLAATVFAIETPLNWVTSLSIAAVAFLLMDISVVPVEVMVSALIATTMALVVMILLTRYGNADRVLGMVRPRLPEHWRDPVERSLRLFFTGVSAIGEPRRALRVVGATYCFWALEAAAYWAVGQAFDLALGPLEYVVIMLGPNVVRTLPLTPGDVGAFELVVAQLAVLLGASSAAAGGYAIGAHLVVLATMGGFGAVAAVVLGFGLKDLWGAPGAPETDGIPEG